jgi:hypothetical protein
VAVIRPESSYWDGQLVTEEDQDAFPGVYEMTSGAEEAFTVTYQLGTPARAERVR